MKGASDAPKDHASPEPAQRSDDQGNVSAELRASEDRYYYSGWHGTVYYVRPATYGYAVVYRPAAARWVAGAAVIGTAIWRYNHPRNIDITVKRNVYGGGHPARPANPLGPRDPRGAADPRGVRDPRGAADPRGRADPRSPSTRRPNNVFADKKGNVHRQGFDGWQKRDKGGWSKPSSSERSRADLNRDSKARSRGSERSRSFSGFGGRSGRSRSFGGGRRGRR
jgi:hypothetical protein